MKGWVGLVVWPVADGLPTLVVTHQLQVERRTGKVHRPETDVLPLCHATNLPRHQPLLPTQVTICFKQLKTIQIGLCMPMSSSIHLHGLHLTTSMVRHDICRHNYAVERGLVVGFCGQSHYCYLVTNPTIRQPGFHLPCHTWSLMNRLQTGHGPCCVTCTNQVSSNHLPVIVASDRPRTTLSTRAH